MGALNFSLHAVGSFIHLRHVGAGLQNFIHLRHPATLAGYVYSSKNKVRPFVLPYSMTLVVA